MLSDLRRLSLFAIVLAAVSFPPAAHGQQEPPPATTVPTPEPPHRPRIKMQEILKEVLDSQQQKTEP